MNKITVNTIYMESIVFNSLLVCKKEIKYHYQFNKIAKTSDDSDDDNDNNLLSKYSIFHV